jgi:hypothetical protein
VDLGGKEQSNEKEHKSIRAEKRRQWQWGAITVDKFMSQAAGRRANSTFPSG